MLAVVCCAGPILIGAVATTGMGAWLATHGYTLAAGAALVLGAMLGWRGLARVWPEAGEDEVEPELELVVHVAIDRASQSSFGRY